MSELKLNKTPHDIIAEVLNKESYIVETNPLGVITVVDAVKSIRKYAEERDQIIEGLINKIQHLKSEIIVLANQKP